MKQLSAWMSFLFGIVSCLNALAGAPNVKRTVIEVPFELIHGAILVQATVNGHGPHWMMLDTGADPSIVEIGTAKSMGVKIDPHGQQGSGGGTDSNPVYASAFQEVQLGGFTANNVDALAMNLSKLSSALERPIGGVLGYSLLKGRIAQIDYPNRRLRFLTNAPSCTSDRTLRSPKCTTLSFQYKDDILASGVAVNGKPVTTNVDTGSNSTFQLAPAAVAKLVLHEDVARAHASRSVGFNGDLKNREGSVRNVTVGAISVDNPTVVFLGKGMGSDTAPWDLRIGSAFLRDYVVTLDYIHGQITLAAP